MFYFYLFVIKQFFINFFITVSECQFGKTVREIGSTWFADLGPPFGVMYCIRCECVAVSTAFIYKDSALTRPAKTCRQKASYIMLSIFSLSCPPAKYFLGCNIRNTYIYKFY